MVTTSFDPVKKELALRAESSSWETSVRFQAEPGDIPVVDIAAYVESGSPDDLGRVAELVNEACETVGFFQLVGHTVQPTLIRDMFDAVHSFHDLPVETKRRIEMDGPDWPLGGVGYLPLRARKLPTRNRGNLNEAVLIKGQEGVDLRQNQWLPDEVLPGFRSTVEAYVVAINDLALRLLPIYATALGLDAEFFDPGFENPTWRLRMTHYPADQAGAADNPGDGDEFGIAPHVDTTFFTLLLQDAPGLTIFSHVRNQWIKAPVVENAFVVNSGELLKQWTNDRYLSVRHFANNDAHASRYSIPFFYNATASHPMECIPTCCSDENPARYPPISYGQSQAVAQGE